MTDGTQQLPETSRNALLRIADELRAGFTGQIKLHCSEGAVATLKQEHTFKSEDLRDEPQPST